jgi:hypothetical protein
MNPRQQSPKDQFEHFLETARALGCDEDEERFEKQLGKIATHKPKDSLDRNKARPKKEQKNE